MTKKLTLTTALLLILQCSFGQIVNRFGINAGIACSNQIWDYKYTSFSPDNNYKIGIQTFFFAEKELSEILSLHTGLGYIQKGFKDIFEFTFPDGTLAGENNDNVVLHNLALDLELKIHPMNTMFSPYLMIGCRSEYLISYKDAVIKEPSSGLEFGMFETQLKEYNKFNFGGLLGLGVDIKQLCYFEVEFNPNFTKNFENEGLSIKDICWGAKLGLNINKLIK